MPLEVGGPHRLRLEAEMRRQILRTAGERQKSEIRGQGSGVKLISDLRLLTSLIDGFNDLNDLNDLNDFYDLLLAPGLKSK
jgi:hypothetical protein